MKHPFGIAGIIVAVIGITIAVFQDDIREQFFPEPETKAESVVSKGLELIGIGEKDDTFKRDKVTVTYSALGLLALVLGIVGYVRKESHRVAGMAGALGIIAVGWQYVLIGLIVAVVVFLLANLGIG